MPRSLRLVALILLAGCSGTSSTPTAPPDDAAERAARQVWLGLDDAAAGFDTRGEASEADPVQTCDGPFGTWFTDFGVRGLACLAAQVAAPASLVALAPAPPFESGPHRAAGEAVDLDLSAPRAFGHYDPAFVRWAWATAVPEGAAVRAMVAPVYRRRVARLARTYWLTHADLAAAGFPERTPAGPLLGYATFLDGGPVPAGAQAYESPGFSVFAFTDRSETLLPDIGLPIANDWEAKYEANAAYGFWLRRRADGTHGLWRDGLRDLLAAFDADWLAEHEG
ncbi:hypothetical protein [Rubrivirga sp.]|uniref:hypothetical protein n=1 Tax=Rubrivirga sp. TaxID=1885344 RepID=UPI003B52ACEE